MLYTVFLERKKSISIVPLRIPRPRLKQHAHFIICTLKTWQHGAEELAHWLKCLPCKCADWSLAPRHLCNSQGCTAAHLYF